MRRLAALAAAVAALAAPAAARADGDPASDVLIAQDVYYPYGPNEVSAPVRRALDAMVKDAHRAGYPVKVALIAAEPDLGAYPDLISQPQKYADLLLTEIAFNAKPPLLVVLPAGIGGDNLGPRAGAALAGLTVAGKDGDDLARTAMTALGRLTRAAGRPVAVPEVAASPSGGGGGGGAPAWLVYGLPVLLVTAGAGMSLLRRDRGEQPPGDGSAG